MKTVEISPAFTRFTWEALNEVRRAKGVEFDPLATATLFNVDYTTYRRHALGDERRPLGEDDAKGETMFYLLLPTNKHGR